MTGLNRWTGVALLMACASMSVGQVVVTPKHADGLYAPGDIAGWTVSPATRSATTQANFAVLRNGRTPPAMQGTIDLTAGPATIEYAAADAGQATVVVTPRPAAGPVTQPTTQAARDGAIFGLRQIRPALPAPDDFDAWWADKLAELKAVPIDAKLEPVDTGTAGVAYQKITLANVNQTRVRGQIALPAKEGKFPAILQFQYAGVYPLQRQWVTDRARAGWLAMNVQAHDMPIDDAAAITKLAQGELKNYQAIGNTDREKSYFLRMYLGDCRALQYLASRPDWDGKTLVVMGDSMGGQQSVATVGLVGQAVGVTAMIVHVPAGGDVGARSAGRSMAYPGWPDQPAAINTGRYFDIANFAPRIKAPSLVSLGLFDSIVPPTSVAAMFNGLAGPAELIALHSDHGGPGQRPREVRREQWLSTLVQGKPAPVNATP